MTNGKARALADQIATSVNTLAAETDAVLQSETFLKWLDAISTFTTYSFNNQILIAMQEWVT